MVPAGRRDQGSRSGEIVAQRSARSGADIAHVRVVARQKSHSHLAFDDKYFLKLYRKLDEGLNPEEEALRWLTSRGFTHAPKLLGVLEYRHAHAERIALGHAAGVCVP